ncbi:MAG: aminodeoxychorismate synthase component I [Planctomycetaceae bacterium]|nr:aminodeoxychorismate synthase component I [Planctomycetaceae bacterium]
MAGTLPLPLVHELSPPPSVDFALRRCATWPGLILFDSARRNATLGRYSFLTADPLQWTVIDQPEYGRDPFETLRNWQTECRIDTIPGLPPFQGGIAGMLGYELGRCWERLPTPPHDEFELPVLAAGCYDWVLAWDHQQNRAWIISQGQPERITHNRQYRAEFRLGMVLGLLDPDQDPGPVYPARQWITTTTVDPAAPHPAPAFGATLHQLPQLDGLQSNFTPEAYLTAVDRVTEYIRAGDIYQANLSQRLLYPARESPIELYLRLRACNAAPFAGFFAHDDWAILSASPERFLEVNQGIVTTRPIKGTRQRRFPPEADLFTQDELLVSPKDVAENVMIVDLLRNDLSRVCRPGSVRIPQLCAIESYETVHHLVSEVQGDLEPDRDAWDLLAATFPGGSITGCPKVRAMEIITELEQVARGPYCGSLFYLGFDGTLDSSILIRTLTHRRGWLQLPAGGGVVAQSDPQAEYEETLHKAAGMLRALRRQPQ